MERNCQWFNEWANETMEELTLDVPTRNRFMTTLMTLLRLN